MTTLARPPEQRTSPDGTRRRLEWLADLMDSRFRVPVLGWRFGLDGLIGLVPLAGDAVTTGVALYILAVAARQGLPKITLARMGLNVALDAVLGAIPFAGDLFDVAFKANLRNVRLLRDRLDAGPAVRRARTKDWLVVGAVLGAVVAVVLAGVVLVLLLFAALIALLRP